MSTERMQEVLRQRGISLVEVIVFIVIIGIGVIGLMNAMNLTTRFSSDPLRRKQTLMIAESLMEEVQLARFTYCDGDDPAVETATSATDCTRPETMGPEAGNVRPFDNVNDYVPAGGTSTTVFNDVNGKLVDAAGNAFPTGFSATLRITPETFGGVASGAATAAMNVLRIEVSVSSVGGETITLDAYRLRYAPNSPP
jgi:MSHA pilin protein MshD